MPSGSSGPERQSFKMQWLTFFHEYISTLKNQHQHLVICGDYNICHQAIDIHNPVSNANSSGFLPEERVWVTNFLQLGLVDTFRYLHPEIRHQYTWWSYRANCRNKNLGWRIDYHLISESLREKLKNAHILSEVRFSDHCPILIELSG
jgi:exodeoxyribonuclease-3